ncbi:hypothetical protein AV521_39825 [Streptomyces sp. IMTB 2501]|uniref:hypothetical protein n=1 Tax=Streptomyces sp. IMTB 2501 TaxID=1776340 RepID=UPI00096DBC23|nr:hypothetical protein [Streptomyces sp. IMTB 2501]OLZ63148.1 hypothetical protein AV521_39825 [Streptomyces sp. IMTB 2501]
MIVVVGHPDLTASTLALLEEELRSRLAGFARAGRAGLVRAGKGLPVAFGRAARKAGLAMVTVLPSRNGVPAYIAEPDRKAAGELLLLSQQVRLVEYDPADRTSCISADEGLLRSCARVLAVWDGSPSSGKDATAHLVAYARSHGVDVEVLWPQGAEHGAVQGELA